MRVYFFQHKFPDTYKRSEVSKR